MEEPRTCRICLDTTDENDQGSSRLIRPCRCKGSQRYVHEACLNAWRRQDPLNDRNYWQCPTCGYRYRLQRLTWAAWISSTTSQVLLTLLIFLGAMFVLGFIADPILNFYFDPYDTIATGGGPRGSLIYDDEDASWAEHFLKGCASLGLLGFAKFLLTLSPWNMLNMRGTTIVGGGRRGLGLSGRDRLQSISWITVAIGIVTFLLAVWKGVRAWSRRTLEQASERVMDVPDD
ncbi:hypothetical protein K470DRAFT_255848 [Piedraia hortae CBS 480.64]|uniref:Uncharacterized protein n=1 Tax=Piedraia hortae CBS 480.64 TaxID=1314780 RepID=A0A6A7C543_9PEZI|nr:hypothetical protein K470DRAFT_255848 [Piedraia hortae CBS 480.64]